MEGLERGSAAQSERGLVINGQTINSQVHYDAERGYVKR